MLNDYTADVISQYANECGIQIDIEHERIVIPNDKPEVKQSWAFGMNRLTGTHLSEYIFSKYQKTN